MPATLFDRDALARWYAEQHAKTDPGIRSVYYLPTNAPEREIRFVEVNDLIGERGDDTLEPIDFGVDMGADGAQVACVGCHSEPMGSDRAVFAPVAARLVTSGRGVSRRKLK